MERSRTAVCCADDGALVNLSPGEQVIFEGHPSWRAILGFYLKGILVAAIVGVIAKLVGDGSGTVFLVVLVVIALTVLVGFVKRVATTYTITDRRLNIKRGIVSREIQETRLERVQNVNYSQSRLPAADADRRRRLRHRRHRRLQLHLRGRRQPEQVVQQVEHATRCGTGLQGEAEPETRS